MNVPKKVPDKPLTPRHAWQPFTPRGVAAFATATLARLLFVQLVILALVALALISFVRVAWVPVIDEAIQQLPDTGAIRRGELNYAGESPRRLAGNPRLALVVDAEGTRAAGQVADLEVAFERRRVVLRGPVWESWREYPANYAISFNRPELGPWWGAWQWAVLSIVALAFGAAVFASWWALALVYLPLVKGIAFFADRVVTWRGAWRLSAAALLPGAGLVALALVLYSFGAVDLIRFGLLYALHVLAGFLFVITSPFFLPKLSDVPTPKNPFGGEGETSQIGPFHKS